MPFTLTMPKLSPTMESGNIVKWHKKEGDAVKEGDLLFEVATDKATVEHNALDEGVLRKILVQEGSEATVNQAVAIFTESADESIEGYEPEGSAPTAKSTVAEEKPAEGAAEAAKPTVADGLAQPAFVPEAPPENYRFAFPTGRAGERIAASPLARKIAEEEGIDLTSIKGSGPNGRIMSRDLKNAPRGTAQFGTTALPTKPAGSYVEEPLTPMRKAIGSRLQASKTFIPHFYLQVEVDATNMMQIREQLKAGGIKVTFNDFIVRACAIALKEHPVINSGFNSETQSIIRFQTIDLAIAVTIDEGLITPIVRHADHKNISQLSQEVRELATRAKQGKLAPEEYRGGSFTISNLGMFGIHDFQAVINPPQAAILAVGGILDKPVVKNNAVVPGKVLPLSLSADHRVIDGSDSARFMKRLKEILENPSLLLI
ncbi:MAG: pyruvate dehydrogenase complex dihydrolipoamide acetyltransferase [Candidatus Algichlamydia australiensis]|nr:pyruvate dehydrogenase complex dihydrolipoamide acetyltransferase [Chlamydiales bacterium]